MSKDEQRENAVLSPRQALCGEWAAAPSAATPALRMPRHSVLAIFVLAVLSGCASYHPRVLVPSVTAAAFQARSLDNPKLRTFLAHFGRPPKHWPKRHWNLDNLALVALYESPELAAQRARWAVVRAGVITAGQRPNPRISFLSQHHSIAPGGVLPWTLGFSFDVPIETAGKRGDRIQQALDLASAARFQVGETAWQLRNRVRQRFLDLFAAIEQIKVLKAETAVRSRMLELISQRFSVGESATFEVNSAQLALQRTQMALAAAKAHAASVRAALAEALGLPVGAIADTRFDFTSIDRLPALQQLSTRTLERVALLHRLDLRRALAQYAAAEDTLKLEIAKQYPNINLGPGYEWEEGDSRWSLSLLSLTLPLLNQNQGPIAVAKARVTEESARFAALQAQVIGQVSQAVVGYRGAVQTLHTAQNLFTTQTKHQRMLDQRFAAGAIGSVAMLGGHLASLVAAQDRLAALYQAQQALGTLENALQRPFTEHLSLKPALHEKSPSGRERARA